MLASMKSRLNQLMRITGIGLLCFFWSSILLAQLEINPQFARLRSQNDLRIGGTELRPATSYMLGADVLVGASNLVPFGGLFYQSIGYRFGDGDRFISNQLSIPLGLAYRLRTASTSFNLVGLGAVAPGLNLTDDDAPFNTGQEVASLQWQARVGLALYLDYITLHADWWFPLADHWKTIEGQFRYTTLGIGVRF